MRFEPLTIDEVLDVVLPEMRFRHWRYSAACDSDRALGKHIWTIVNPSLRKLRNLLQLADQIVSSDDRAAITREVIDEAFTWTASAADNAKLKELDRKREATSFEAESERRHEAKRKGS